MHPYNTEYTKLDNNIYFLSYYYIGDYMKQKLKRVFFLLLLLIFPVNAVADTGHSTIIMDIDSGRILYQKNIHDKKLIASTTKIMTCIVVLENFDIEKEIEIGEEVLSMYGTNIYIEVGEKIKIKDLLYGLMLRSGNDAAITLAYNTVGEEKFVDKMNELAKKIGMNDTSFENPHGLDDNTKNYSTAYDMALLSKYAYKNSMYRKIISTKKYVTKSSLKSYVWYNRMSLLNKYKDCIGGKNGYTPKAGKSLVSYAKRKDMTLTIVSLDDPQIYTNHKELYNTYFNKYNNYIIVDKDNFVISPFLNNKDFYIKETFKYPLTNNELKNVKTVAKISKAEKNGVAGKIEIDINNKKIYTVNIYKKKYKKKKDISIFQKIKNLFIR